MPNGGTHHCGHCRHLDGDRCTLREVPIADTHYTCCMSWNADTETAYGPLLAMVEEVKKGAGGHVTVPYLGDRRPESVQVSRGTTVLRVLDAAGEQLEFPTAGAYLDFLRRSGVWF